MLCEVLDLAPSGYYAWLKRAPLKGPRVAARAVRPEEVRQAFYGSKGRYGSPRKRVARNDREAMVKNHSRDRDAEPRKS